jgi:hypothetical protein
VRRHDTGRGTLARIIAVSFTAAALALPVAAVPAAAAPAGAGMVQSTPPGRDGGGRSGGPSQQELEQKRREREAERAADADRKVEEQRLKAIERARKERVRRAERAAKARSSWDDRGQPRRMVTVRADRVEVVDNGRLATLVSRRPGALNLRALDRMLPADWITVDGDTTTVNTSIVLTPGVNLEIIDIPTVRLTGGPEPADSSSIYTGTGRLTLRNTTLAGVDGGGQPLAFDAAGRPFINVSGGGKLDATDVTITDMGLPERGVESARAAISFSSRGSGSLVRTTLQRNNIGVHLSGTQDVRLDGLTVTGSEEDGIILDDDHGTRMANVRAEGNGGNGMVVSGEVSDRPITSLTTHGNKLYGLVVTQQQGARVSGVSTHADGAGGLRLNQAVDVHITDFSATDQPIGVFTHVGSTGIVLDGIRTNGGRRGVVVEKSTTNLDLRNSTIEGSRVAGVNIGGKKIQVNAVQVTDAKAGVRIERGAAHIQLNGMTLDGGRDGVVSSPGAQDVTIADLTTNDIEDGAIRMATPDAVISGGTINGGATGIQITAAATITAVAINGPVAGIRVRSADLVRAENIAVEATDLGLDVSPGSQFVLANSSVHALEAVRGVFVPEGINNITLPPLNLLAAMGLPLIVLAVVLEQVHSYRQRKVGGLKPPKPPAIPVGGS